MADDKESGGGLGGNNVILLLIAAVSAVYVGWHGQSLVSNRPSEQGIGTHPIEAAQDIDARLWQDPFTAVEKGDQPSSRSSKKDDEQHNLDHVFLNYSPGSSVLALAVALPGAPYPEAAESRRRLRYAILAALHAENYTPADEKHIGNWVTDTQPAATGTPAAKTCTRKNSRAEGSKRPCGCGWPAEHSPPRCHNGLIVDGTEPEAAIPQSIPFEWFDSEATAPSDKKNSVLVLWLDEDFVTAAHRPIASLERARYSLQQKIPSLEFVLLGPQDSTTLRVMLEDIKNSKAGQQPNYDKSWWSLYNFSASADDQKLLALVGQSTREPSIPDIFYKRHIRYRRTISSDRELAEILRHELGLRDSEAVEVAAMWDGGGEDMVAEGLHSSHIALISEWDTVYGELLPKTTQEVFAATKDGESDHVQDEWIKSYSYLRGLDGLAADRKRTQPKPQLSDNDDGRQKSTDQGATPGTASNFEGAEGQSQYDYLYRLADRLHQWDEKLRRDGKGKVDAVGVLGSDVYDKLLILQALRPNLPEAVFFTTDLDALLLPQGKSHYTRGLLVASAYGLRLRDELQGDILPFRSSYETSAFLATRLAVEREASDREEGAKTLASNNDPAPGASCDGPVTQQVDLIKAWNCSPHQPLLFQIGLTAPRQLVGGSSPSERQSGKAATDKVCEGGDLTRCDSIQPPISPFYPRFGSNERIGLSLIPALLSILLFVFPQVRKVCFYRIGPRSGSVSKEISLTILRVILPVSLTVALLAFLGWLFLGWDHWAPWLTDGRRGEPVTLFEGISIWPTIALRVFGIVLSLFLVWYTLRNLEVNRYEVGEEFNVWRSLPKIREVLKYMRDTLKDPGSLISVKMKILSLFWFPPMGAYHWMATDDFGRRKILATRIVSGGYSNAWYIRCIRSGLYTIFMIRIVWPLIISPIFVYYGISIRGSNAYSIYQWVTLIDGILALFLVFLVMDATLYSCAFIMRLTQISMLWPTATIAKYKLRFWLMGKDGLSDFIDMKYLEGRTKCITHLVYFPFIALATLLLSRNPLLDDFSMPTSVWIVYGICIVAVIGSVLAYRSAAEVARRAARQHLTARITAAKSSEETMPHASQLEMMLDEIDKLNKGAFAPLTSQPLVKAVLLPLITYGGTWLLHVYALPGT